VFALVGSPAHFGWMVCASSADTHPATSSSTQVRILLPDDKCHVSASSSLGCFIASRGTPMGRRTGGPASSTSASSQEPHEALAAEIWKTRSFRSSTQCCTCALPSTHTAISTDHSGRALHISPQRSDLGHLTPLRSRVLSCPVPSSLLSILPPETERKTDSHSCRTRCSASPIENAQPHRCGPAPVSGS
jgi:hypothetical protein